MSLRARLKRVEKLEKLIYRQPTIIFTFSLDGIEDKEDVIIVHMNIGI